MLIQIDENSATLTPFGSLARKAPANARTEGRSWAKLLRTLANEDRAACRSPRSEGSLSAFRRRRDCHHADREFPAADLLLSLLGCSQIAQKKEAREGPREPVEESQRKSSGILINTNRAVNHRRLQISK
jgi:hypothetical protein